MTSQRMQWSRCLLLMMMLIWMRDVTNDAMAVPVQRSRMPASLTDICDVACRQVRRFCVYFTRLSLHYHSRMQCGNVFSRICLSVCNAVTFESLDLESSFLICTYIFRISRASLYIKVIGSRLRSQSTEACLYIPFVGGLPSIERQSCLTCVISIILLLLLSIILPLSLLLLVLVTF